MSAPAEWKQLTLGQLCSLRKEPVRPSADGTNRYVGLEHIDSGIPRLQRWGTDEGLRSTKNRFYKGDVLYGKLRPYLDKVALAEWEGVCSTDILTLQPHTDILDAVFLSILMHTPEFRAHAISTTSGVNHPRTSWSNIAKYNCYIPPVAEQRVIASVFSSILNNIQIQDRKLAAQKSLFSSTCRLLMTGQVRVTALQKSETPK